MHFATGLGIGLDDPACAISNDYLRRGDLFTDKKIPQADNGFESGEDD